MTSDQIERMTTILAILMALSTFGHNAGTWASDVVADIGDPISTTWSRLADFPDRPDMSKED